MTTASESTSLIQIDAACTPGSVHVYRPLRDDEALDLAAAFKALGNPVRLKIINLLSQNQGQVCVCDIEAQFTLTQPTISHHLKVLRDAGLIVSEQRGLWVYHRVRPSALTALSRFLDRNAADNSRED